MTILIIIATATTVLILTARRARAHEKPDPNQWKTVFEKEDGNAGYIDLKNATFSTEEDGHHITFWGQGTEVQDGKLKYSFLGRNDINLTQRLTQDLNYIEFDEKGKVTRRTVWTPEDRKPYPIARDSVMWLMYEMALEHFVRTKILPPDGISGLENPDPEQWAKTLETEKAGYIDVKHATFPNQSDGPHAIFWHLKDPATEEANGEANEEAKRYTLFNIDINLITRTERLLACLEFNEKGETVNGISWSAEENELEPIGYASILWAMYEIILGRYAAERVIPSEGAIAFRSPDPERWHFIGRLSTGVSCYVDRKNLIFYEETDGDHAVFWYQFIATDPKEYKTRLLARDSMNLTTKTFYVTDLIDFDDKGEVKKSYTYAPDEIKVQEIAPETAMWKIYEFIRERAEATRPAKKDGKKAPKKRSRADKS